MSGSSGDFGDAQSQGVDKWWTVVRNVVYECDSEVSAILVIPSLLPNCDSEEVSEVLATDRSSSEVMAGSDRWYFDREVLANTPSRRCGIDSDKELSYRQQAANLIQDMGQRLRVSQLCINTAIVYMHRFYTFHSFTKFHRNSISSCALFLAAKVEEQPRKLEHVIKVSHMCLHRDIPALDFKSEAYKEQAMELVFNENLMLQTLGFDIAVEHPHTSVVNCCQLVRASKDLAQTSYFMATNSLHLTTMCLQHKPTVVACVCIHLACKWSRWEIPRSSEGKDWFYYVDTSVTLDLLEQLTSEFLAILDKCPSRLKRKVISGTEAAGASTSGSHHNSSLNKSIDEKRSSMHIKEENKSSTVHKSSSHHSTERSDKTSAMNSSVSRRSPPTSPLTKKLKTEQTCHTSSQPLSKPPVSMTYAAYRERKEKANTQPDCPKQQPILPNKSSTHKPNRDIVSNPQKERISPKQQIITDRQRQSDERHRLKPKNSDYLFESSSRPAVTAKPISIPTNQKPNNITEDFYDNLLNKPSNFNSIFATGDGDDSLDFKRDVVSNLQMEFSDNSNQSTDGLNLSSFPSDFMNDSSDSKKSLNNNNNNNNSNNNSKSQPNLETKPTSFMSIFSTPIATTQTITPITAATTAQKSDNPKANIPSKYSDVLSRIPPMLSPLHTAVKSAVDMEMIPKLEKPFSSHSSALTHPKNNINLNSELDSKSHQNSKLSKSSPKIPNLLTQQKSSVGSVVPTLKEKEVNDGLLSVKLEPMADMQTSIANLSQTSNLTPINSNMNDFLISSEPIAPVLSKPEIREKSIKAAEVPSVLSKNRAQMSSNLETDVKPNVNTLIDPKPPLNTPISLNPSISVNNTNVASDAGANRPPVIPNKESKDKSSHSAPEEKHHKHSHKSSKHKDKHKHKHKDKDREKSHKRKDKDKDRSNKDRDRDRERGHHCEDPSFKISYSATKDKTDVSNNSITAPIKLKILKKKLSIDEMESSDKDNESVPQNPLKLRIQLKDQKLTTNATDFQSNDSNSGRKRKSSPKSSKKEKISKYENESKTKDKSSSKSKKGSNHMISYDMNSGKGLGQQLYNSETGQALGAPALQSRPQKTHK